MSAAPIRALLPGLATFFLLSLFTKPAAAQDTTPLPDAVESVEDVAVMDRPRPAYDAKGIPLGGFRLFPTLITAGDFDDNVYRLPQGTSDFYFEEAPELRLASQWGRHFLEFYGGADNFTYLKASQLNLTDWNVGADGRYDISRAATVTASASYAELHESLESPNTAGAQAAPNRYFKDHGDLAAVYQPSRLGISLGGTFDRYDWENTPRIGGGELNNKDRNEDEYQGTLKTFYEFSPGYSAFVQGIYDVRRFDRFFDRDGFHRSSHGYRFDGGVDLTLTHLLKGEVFLGYLRQDYAQDVPLPLANVSGLDFGASLDWYATSLITVHLGGGRTVEDSTIFESSAIDNRYGSLSADYEYKRNIIFQAAAEYTQSQFTGTHRNDDYPTFSVTARYLIDRHASVSLAYRYSQRASDLDGLDFADDILRLRLDLHI